MNKTPSNGSYRSVANSQEPAVVKKKITCESALREEGIDDAFVARKLRDFLQAKGRRWNPKKRSWEKCEDYGTELAALREIAKILDIYPGEKRENKVGVKVILSPGCPRPGGPVLGNGEQSIGTAAGDGREHRERWKETGV